MLSKAILNTFTKNGGLVARIITGLIMSGLAALVARFGLDLSPEDVKEISSWVFVLVAGVIGELVTMYQARGIAAMQASVSRVAPEVNVDGSAGETTRNAVQRVASFAGMIQDNGFPVPTPGEPTPAPPTQKLQP